MTEFTVDAVLAFDTNSQPYRFTSRAGCHPSAHTLHRESQAKPAERVESRSGWKMVQTAGAAIPALAWGLNPPEWQDNLIADAQSIGRTMLPPDFIFSRSCRAVCSPPPGPLGPVRAIPFFGQRSGPSHRPVCGLMALGLGDHRAVKIGDS